MCVQVRGGNDGAACGDPECERSRRDLLAVPVGGHEDVGGREELGDPVDAEEAIVELHVILEAEVEHCLLERQPIALAFPVRDIRMRPSGDDVEHLGMALHDCGERGDRRLETLPGRDQPECREHEPVPVLVVRATDRPTRTRGKAQRVRTRALGEHRRRAVGHDSNLVLRARAAVDEEAPCGFGHHDHELCLAANCRQHLGLVRGRLRQHRVQRHDEWLRQLLYERGDIVAVTAAEDPELVLEQDDVDVEPAQDPGGPHVITPHRLCDRRREARPLRT